jgi:hypothetical protein
MTPVAATIDPTHTLARLELRTADDRLLGHVVVSADGAVGHQAETTRLLDFDGLVPTGFDELDARLEAELRSLVVGDTFTCDAHRELGHTLASAFGTEAWTALVLDVRAQQTRWTTSALGVRLFAPMADSSDVRSLPPNQTSLSAPTETAAHG